MTDIVERLEGQVNFLTEHWGGDVNDPDHEGIRLFRDAAIEIKRLRNALRDVQWESIAGRPGTSSYPTCVGCGIVSHGALSTPPHESNCIIEAALNPATAAVKEAVL